MIFYGLLGGIKQVLYVVILLYLLIYVYAVAGIIFFSDNDPWNFSTVEVVNESYFILYLILSCPLLSFRCWFL